MSSSLNELSEIIDILDKYYFDDKYKLKKEKRISPSKEKLSEDKKEEFIIKTGKLIKIFQIIENIISNTIKETEDDRFEILLNKIQDLIQETEKKLQNISNEDTSSFETFLEKIYNDKNTIISETINISNQMIDAFVDSGGETNYDDQIEFFEDNINNLNMLLN